jgi:hypothetical protein
VLIDDDELTEGVETVEGLNNLLDALLEAVDDFNWYKEQLVISVGTARKLAKTAEDVKMIIDEVTGAIVSYAGDRYRKDLRLVRNPDDQGYGIVDLESWDYSVKEGEISGDLSFYESYTFLGWVEDEDKDEAA